jgi:heat shock protein beta
MSESSVVLISRKSTTTNYIRFFSRVDRVLRRSLGVSETAATDTTVKPAPPVDPEIPVEDEEIRSGDEGNPRVELPPGLKDKVSIEVDEIDDDGNVVHDEL